MEKPIGFELLEIGNNVYKFKLKNGKYLIVDKIVDIKAEDDIIEYAKTSFIFFGKNNDVKFKEHDIKISEIESIEKYEAIRIQ